MEKKKGKLFVISGSSGVGKGTLLNLLLKQHPDLKLSISTTTRKPRPGEVDGVNYFFTDKQEFLKEVENGGQSLTAIATAQKKPGLKKL